MEDTTIKILVADDHALFRDGLRILLDAEPAFAVLDAVANGRHLVDKTRLLKPDIIITDLIMPELAGVEAIREISAMELRCGIIALSQFDSDGLVLDAIEAGAAGYLLKNAQKGEIIRAVYDVFNGENFYCMDTTRKFMQRYHQRKPSGNRKLQQLFTQRELEIIRMICEEKTTPQIAGTLFLSPRTIDGYRKEILRKMRTHSSVGIVAYAVRNGLYMYDLPR